MIFIGDIHGDWDAYYKTLEIIKFKPSIQVGDFGLFKVQDIKESTSVNLNMFIRGNHDHPVLCQEHRNYMGDWGYMNTKLGNMFWLGGGYSVDKEWRTPGIDWWEEEELEYKEMEKAIEVYEKCNPQIVVTHECPSVVKTEALAGRGAFNGITVTSRTEQCLNALWERYRPQIWIHGHYHHRYEAMVDGCRFIGLASTNQDTFENSTVEINL